MARGWGDAWRDYTGPVKGERVPQSMTEIMLSANRAPAKKRAKYNAIKTRTSDGVLCDSKGEAARWETLKLLQAGGVIHDLLPHPSFPLYVNGTKTGRFTADALYTEAGKLVIEDTKSTITAKATAYRQRIKTFQACYPHITFREWLT